MRDDCLKLSVYFGESDRVDGRLLSDELIGLFERHGLKAAVLLRAVEGFGIKHKLRTSRFLTLSEDLPLVAVAVDERLGIEAVVPDVTAILGGGLITLERVRMLSGGLTSVELPEELHEATKLTLFLGRDERVENRPAYLEVVEHLRTAGLSGATVFLGVDGMTHGRRERARFFSQNATVPVLVTSVGPGATINGALPRIGELVSNPIATLERVRVCKRDGALLAQPRHLPQQDEAGLGIWQKLMIYAGEQARHDGQSLYVQLVHRLRREGASGATAVRGIWGFSGDHPPRGDRLFHLHRQVPIVITLVDTPDQIQRWFGIIDELTDETGLVTSEMVPAHLAIAPARRVGGLKLGQLRF